MEKNFTVDQIKAALLSIQDKITVPQRAMLKGHSEVRLASMKKIAKFGGYASTSAGNLQYGTLCGRISSELGFVPPRSKTYVIAEVSRKRDAEQHFQWRMDDVVVKALKEIGWANTNR
jgi:predicted HNH restriction endonuclease